MADRCTEFPAHPHRIDQGLVPPSRRIAASSFS
jgi:hypothetical protein